jgi:hypothetical protein
MVYFQTKNSNLGKFWKVLQKKILVFLWLICLFYGLMVFCMANWYIVWPIGTFWGHLVHFVVIWYILWSFGTFCGHLVHFVVIWYILWSFGTFCGHLVHLVVIWYILWSFGTFCGNLVHFVVIWYILWSFGIYFPVLVCCTEKILATLTCLDKLRSIGQESFNMGYLTSSVRLLLGRYFRFKK